MRHVVLDTETTGLDPESHRIVEIGCVELAGSMPTGKVFHHYLNPQIPIPPDALSVHGLTDEFLKDKPLFADVAGEFLEFIGDDPLIIHNAGFDLSFLNAELQRLGYAPLPRERAVDTLALARRRFPGSPASLDALCKRFSVDAAGRNLHGALLDARLLAEVYLELTGGRQAGLSIDFAVKVESSAGSGKGGIRPPRVHVATAIEIETHAAAVASLPGNPWGVKKAAG